jgi:integrase
MHKRYPGSIERRGNSYRVTLSVDNVVHRFTVATRDKKLAEKAAEQRYVELREAAARKAVGLPDAVTFSAFVDLYIREELTKTSTGTQACYGDSLAPLRKFFVDTLGDPLIGSVLPAHCTRYLDWRATSSVSPRTVNKDRAVLRRLFSVAEMRGHCVGNPVKRTEARKVDAFEPVILDEEQYARLLAECAKRAPMLGLYALLLGETGMRSKSEALHLRWDDIDLASGRITIKSGRDGHRTKSGKSRIVPITSTLAAGLRDYFAAFRFTSSSPFIFAHTGAARSGERIATLRFAFAKAAVAAKIPEGWRIHDLRHRRVTTWLGAGKSPVAVQGAMGHSTITTTMGYFTLLPEHLAQLVDDLPSLTLAVSTG